MSELPETINTRSPEQWRIINERVDFSGKTVIDLGCGHGDILARTRLAGAKEVSAIESDLNIAVSTASRLTAVGIHPVLHGCDLERIGEWEAYYEHYDISICFSVLPYIENYRQLLQWMHDRTGLSLIEVQYVDDGPGSDWKPRIHNDEEMHFFLKQIWPEPLPIGKTLVEGRNKYRSIWLCKSLGKHIYDTMGDFMKEQGYGN